MTPADGGKHDGVQAAMKKLIYYSVVASMIGMGAQLAGMSMGAAMLLSLTVPSALLIAWIVLKARANGGKAREDYWMRRL